MTDNFPHVIYFDTNALRELTFGISNVEYLKLKEFCKSNSIGLAVPEVVVYEWYYMQRREVLSEIDRIKQAIKKTNLLLNITQPEYKVPKKLFPSLASKVNQYIREAEMRGVKTTRKISIRKLIILAAKKTKPFEEKGEKGFRDMIMLLSIVEDMKKHNFRDGILITNDNIFQHEEIRQHLQGKNVKVMNNFSQCFDYLDKLKHKKAVDYFSAQSKRILEYLQTQKNTIFKYVVENAQVSADFLRGDFILFKEEEKIFGNIDKVIEATPKNISAAFPSLTRKSEPLPANMGNITFTVNVDFRLQVSPYNFFNKPKFPISTPAEYEKIKSTYPSLYLQTVEKIVNRPINVEAIIDEKDGKYTNLILKRVITY